MIHDDIDANRSLSGPRIFSRA